MSTLELSPIRADDVVRVTSSLRGLMKRPVAVIAVAFLGLLVIASVAAPLIAPFDPRAQDLTRVLSGPTAHNLLGTDTLGRDVLSRILYGGRRSLLSVIEGLSVVLVLGVPLGLVAGYFGGWTDRLLTKVAELLLAIPAIILILVVLAVAPHNEDAAMITFGLLGTPAVLRVVRGASLRVREDLYVAAARVSGLSHVRIVTRHILPRVTGPIIVQASLFAAYALLFESSIGYLGLTADAATPTWGGMVGEAATVIQQQEWLVIPAGGVIALTILALGLLGDAVRDALVAAERSSSPTRRMVFTDDGPPHQPDDSDALLQVRDLTVALERERRVVDGITFDVFPGETLGIVGESGCGKSVMAHALLRLLPPELNQLRGNVWWDAQDITRLPDRAFDRLRGSTFAYISQEPQASLDPTFTVGSQLVEAIRHHTDLSRSQARRRAAELLALVELPEPERVARARAHELSGGMAQRVCTALALAGAPKLLIADEPTTALDVTVQADILALFRRIQEETGMAIVLITHNWGVVADMCDRVIVMYAGQIIETAGVQAVFDQPLHPYSLGLLESHPSLAESGVPLAAMRGAVPSPGAWPAACRFAPRCRFVTDECLHGAIPLVEQEAGRKSRCVRAKQIFSEVRV